MKLRPKAPDFDPKFAPLLAELFLAYEEGVERCREVALAAQIDEDLRERALATAVRIAYVSRATWEALVNLDLVDQLPVVYRPNRVMAASARLAYSLTATADVDSEAETILSIGELDGLPLQYDLQEWFDAVYRPKAAG